jgi:predicted MFS family arabinose efflux permease
MRHNDQALASSRYKWYVVGMLWWTGFFNYADRQAIFSVFPLLESQFHLNTVQLGWLGSSFALIYGLASPLAGAIVDRVRRKQAILAGLYIWSIICAATAWSRSFAQLLVFRAAEGLGEAFYFPASMSMIAGYHQVETRSRAMGLHQTSVYIGTIAGGYFGGRIGQQFGWRWSFVVFGGLGMFLGLLLNRGLREPQRPDPPAAETPAVGTLRAAILASPAAMLLLLAFLLSNFVAVVLLTWMPKFLYDEFHLSLAMSGLTATLFVQLASMAGSPAGGWLADAWRRRTPGGRMLVQSFSVLAGAPFVVLCGHTRSVPTLLIALTVWGWFKGMHDANIFASLFDVVPVAVQGKAAGLMNMTGWLGGGATAPVVIGYLARSIGLGPAISFAATAYVAAGILLLIAARSRQ